MNLVWAPLRADDRRPSVLCHPRRAIWDVGNPPVPGKITVVSAPLWRVFSPQGGSQSRKSRDTFTWAICLIAFAVIAMVETVAEDQWVCCPQSCFTTPTLLPSSSSPDNARDCHAADLSLTNRASKSDMAQPRYIPPNLTFQSATTTIRMSGTPPVGDNRGHQEFTCP